VQVGCCETSPNQQLLAWTEDTVGGEKYTLHVKVREIICGKAVAHMHQHLVAKLRRRSCLTVLVTLALILHIFVHCHFLFNPDDLGSDSPCFNAHFSCGTLLFVCFTARICQLVSS
jgi:hypothetical protein